MEIIETKSVWLTIGNTDLTEGRGYPLILYVCESKETAIRLGRKKSVQGSDCHVEEATAVKVGRRWLVPGDIQHESKDDAVLRQQREQREALVKKMREQGFSEEEIAILGK